MIVCDRCRTPLPHAARYYGGTIGFYDTTDHQWSKFANPGETVVCDNCMRSDPRYLAVYNDPRIPQGE